MSDSPTSTSLTTEVHSPPAPENIRTAQHLQAASVEQDLVDDRYDGDPPALVVIASQDGSPVGSLSGWWRGGTFHATAELMPGSNEAETLSNLLCSLRNHLGTLEVVELWGRPERPAFWAVSEDVGFVPRRHLLQMSIALPTETAPLETRAFRPGRDDEAVVQLNNRAFAGHPEQGGWTVATLNEQVASDWFQADGLRIYEEADAVVGFCWVKLHPDRNLGEIYVIGLDPSVHGRGLGGPMTAAGLRWMAERGLRRSILFVEAENVPAVRTYERLGFHTVVSDRSWGTP